MHKISLLLLLSFSCFLSSAEPLVTLHGTIGKYKIEMELNSDTKGKSDIKGKYRYAGKTAYLDIQGDMYGSDIVYLEESWNGKVTGSFYLEWDSEGLWKGKWIGDKAVHEAQLKVQTGSMSMLRPYTIESHAAFVSEGISGSYVSEHYFINEMWYSEENPNLEIGFNGGVVTVKELSSDKLEIHFNQVCGPTYHLAYFSGEAVKIGEGKYEYRGNMDADEDCHLQFSFKSGAIEITQVSSGFACGFGARAYADGTFEKVNDEAVEGEDLSVEDVLPR